jgi:hypothetical protein
VRGSRLTMKAALCSMRKLHCMVFRRHANLDDQMHHGALSISGR